MSSWVSLTNDQNHQKAMMSLIHNPLNVKDRFVCGRWVLWQVLLLHNVIRCGVNGAISSSRHPPPQAPVWAGAHYTPGHHTHCTHPQGIIRHLYHIPWSRNICTIPSIVCEASCHPVIWSFSHPVIQSFCHPIIPSSHHPIIPSSNHLVIHSRLSHHHVISTCPQTNWLTDEHTTLGSTGLLRRQIYKALCF